MYLIQLTLNRIELIELFDSSEEKNYNIKIRKLFMCEFVCPLVMDVCTVCTLVQVLSFYRNNGVTTVKKVPLTEKRRPK